LKRTDAPDIEQKVLVGDCPADSADVVLVLFDHDHAMAGLGETVSGGQPGGAGSDNQGVGRLHCALHADFATWRRTVED
jgi:hypothetical protein